MAENRNRRLGEQVNFWRTFYSLLTSTIILSTASPSFSLPHRGLNHESVIGEYIENPENVPNSKEIEELRKSLRYYSTINETLPGVVSLRPIIRVDRLTGRENINIITQNALAIVELLEKEGTFDEIVRVNGLELPVDIVSLFLKLDIITQVKTTNANGSKIDWVYSRKKAVEYLNRKVEENRPTFGQVAWRYGLNPIRAEEYFIENPTEGKLIRKEVAPNLFFISTNNQYFMTPIFEYQLVRFIRQPHIMSALKVLQIDNSTNPENNYEIVIFFGKSENAENSTIRGNNRSDILFDIKNGKAVIGISINPDLYQGHPDIINVIQNELFEAYFTTLAHINGLPSRTNSFEYQLFGLTQLISMTYPTFGIRRTFTDLRNPVSLGINISGLHYDLQKVGQNKNSFALGLDDPSLDSVEIYKMRHDILKRELPHQKQIAVLNSLLYNAYLLRSRNNAGLYNLTHLLNNEVDRMRYLDEANKLLTFMGGENDSIKYQFYFEYDVRLSQFILQVKDRDPKPLK